MKVEGNNRLTCRIHRFVLSNIKLIIGKGWSFSKKR